MSNQPPPQPSLERYDTMDSPPETSPPNYIDWLPPTKPGGLVPPGGKLSPSYKSAIITNKHDGTQELVFKVPQGSFLKKQNNPYSRTTVAMHRGRRNSGQGIRKTKRRRKIKSIKKRKSKKKKKY